MKIHWCVSFVTAVLCLPILAACTNPAQAQSESAVGTGPARAESVSAGEKSRQSQSEKGEGCNETILSDHKIREVKIKARYLPNLASPLPKPGTPYSPELLSPILEDVYNALRIEANRSDPEGATEMGLLKTVTAGKGLEKSSSAEIGLNFVTSCTRVIDEDACLSALGAGNSKCVDISIHAFSIRVDTGNPIANLLNIPRSNRPSFLSDVPGPVLAFNPKPGFDVDRNFGASATFGMATNLLDLSRNLKQQSLRLRRTRLDLSIDGRRSLNEPFYQTTTRLSLTRSFSKIDELGIEAGFTSSHEPLSVNEYSRNAAKFGVSMRVRTAFKPLGDVALNARYRWSKNRFSSKNALPSEFTSENALEASALFDGGVWRGVSRLALWAEAASPDKNRPGYQRAALLWGYQREFIVVPNQTIGVEALVGGGRAWGDVPQYARFYGGNDQKNFLYEAKNATVVTSFPSGPLLRSLGTGQLTTRNGATQGGGTSYWNLSLNVSVPVPKWSSPLIPDISIEIPTKDANGHAILDSDNNQVTEERPLRVVLKNQGEASRKVVERTLLKKGVPAAEAKATSERELRSINSILGFIADQANIYSFKPLFMFDVARLNAPGTVNNQTRFAAGGGLQFTVVIAKFEAGYMRTLQPLPGDKKGNFVMRLFFQNLF